MVTADEGLAGAAQNPAPIAQMSRHRIGQDVIIPVILITMRLFTHLLTTTLACVLCEAQTRGGVGVNELSTRTVYHSPQTPGFTNWVGCWLMPGGKLMVSFHQATGPLKGRYRARADILHQLSWPPEGKPEYVNYDMTGLDFQAIHLESNDDGGSWQQASTEHVST